MAYQCRTAGGEWTTLSKSIGIEHDEVPYLMKRRGIRYLTYDNAVGAKVEYRWIEGE